MTTKQLGAALWIAIGIMLFIEQVFAVDETYDFTIVYLSGAFILIYALLMVIHIKHDFSVPVVLFITFSLCIIECTINMDSTGIGTTSRTSYLLDYDAVKTVTSTVAEDDSSFYRMDKSSAAVLTMMVHGITTTVCQHSHQPRMVLWKISW